VLFNPKEIFLPSPEELAALSKLTEEAEGTVIGFSDSGPHVRAFVVLEVVQRWKAVVPIEKVRLIDTGPDS
jgi:hypothetical protein